MKINVKDYFWVIFFFARPCLKYTFVHFISRAGADPGFQVRGGGTHKKIAPSGGRREICWGISCEKSRFYAKKSYFFQLRREARTFLGYFVWKITILRKKILFFPILEEGGRAPGAPPPWSALGEYLQTLLTIRRPKSQ